MNILIEIFTIFGQIEDKHYRQELEALGANEIIEIGIAFEGKKVMVKAGLPNTIRPLQSALATSRPTRIHKGCLGFQPLLSS